MRLTPPTPLCKAAAVQGVQSLAHGPQLSLWIEEEQKKAFRASLRISSSVRNEINEAMKNYLRESSGQGRGGESDCFVWGRGLKSLFKEHLAHIFICQWTKAIKHLCSHVVIMRAMYFPWLSQRVLKLFRKSWDGIYKAGVCSPVQLITRGRDAPVSWRERAGTGVRCHPPHSSLAYRAGFHYSLSLRSRAEGEDFSGGSGVGWSLTIL